MGKNIKEYVYFVTGTHCASCEVLIENKLLELKNIRSVEASAAKGRVLIEYDGQRPTLERLNKLFSKEGYVFSDQPEKMAGDKKTNEFFAALAVGLLIIAGFAGLNRLGLGGLVNVGSTSSLPMFFIFGLIAGVSSCAALVGGLVLSMSKQWNELYAQTDSARRKLQPHLIFNAGRLIAYGVFGTVLGAIGSRFDFSLKFGPVLVIVVSAMMILLAWQMLGFKAFRRFQLTLPRFVTRFAANKSNFKGRHMPFLTGAFTFFLPCGFTITAQGLALISGSAIQGGLIMFLFALGTLPMLLTIGLSSVKFSRNPKLSEKFLKVAGVLVLFFALYNINFQLNVLGVSNLGDLRLNLNNEEKNPSPNEEDPIQLVNGQQVIRMDASARGYSPNYFKVKRGLPVRWEITDKGTGGCTNAVISKSLFDGEVSLTPGQTAVKEFTPEKPGKYKFSCWMGMVSGIIEVIG